MRTSQRHNLPLYGWRCRRSFYSRGLGCILSTNEYSYFRTTGCDRRCPEGREREKESYSCRHISLRLVLNRYSNIASIRWPRLAHCKTYDVPPHTSDVVRLTSYFLINPQTGETLPGFLIYPLILLETL